MQSDAKDETRERTALETCSAQMGADPLQIQAAGGNTSVKQGDTLWIKASGKWLMHAQQESMFVPVKRSALLAAREQSDPRAEKAIDFVDTGQNQHALRPSIETTLHAVMPQRVVMHVHCVDTIALAVRDDAVDCLSGRLANFSWVFVPYVRPGLPLSTLTLQQLQDDTDVVVLGNHGLVVGAESVTACHDLLQSVRMAVKATPRTPAVMSSEALVDRLQGDAYRPAQISEAHAIAFDERATSIASGGSLYPDHVIFLGKGTVVAAEHETANDVVQRCLSAQLDPPVYILFPRQGVAMAASATEGQQAMARCLADVCLRIAPDAPIRYLDDRQNYELLNWEAEQYRQTLNQ